MCQNTKLVIRTLTLALCGTALLAETAGAQVNEILVTARKREQSIQDVPLSITALTETTLDRLGIDDFRDYATQIPGITLDFSEGPTGTFGRRNVGIRGVTRQGGLSQSSVGFYLDETPVDIVDPRIFDVNRIEVLRGPQGTLYGSGSVGGTIKIVTNQPDTDAFSAKFDGDYSHTNEGGGNYALNGMVNIPIVEDRLALRVVGMYRDIEGYVDAITVTDPSVLRVDGNPLRAPISFGSDFSPETSLPGEDINSEEVAGIRASLLFEPIDGIRITPSIYYQNLELGGEPEFSPALGSGFKTTRFRDISSEEEFILASVNLEWDLDFGQVVSTTSYYDLKNEATVDTTVGNTDTLGLVFCVFDPMCATFTEELLLPGSQDSVQTQQSWVHETRFVSDFGGPFQLTTGLFYEYQKRPFVNIFGVGPSTAGATIFGLGTTGFGAFLDALLIPNLRADGSLLGGDVRSTRDQRQIAIFGEGTLNVLDNLEVTIGIRYFNFETSSTDAFEGFLFTAAAGVNNAGESEEDGLNPSFAISYQPTADHTLYARAAKGFRAGGANIPLSDSCLAELGGPASDFESDDLWNYEVGAKTSWLDNRVTVNGTAFYITWDNIQTPIGFSLACGIQGYFANGGKAESKGVEFEFSAQPFEGFDVGLNLAYTDAEFTEDFSISSFSISDGAPLPNTPKWTGSASIRYSRPLLGDFDGYIQLSGVYRDEAVLDLIPLGGIAMPNMSDSYFETNLRLGVTHENFEISLFADNLSNEDPILAPNAKRAFFPGAQVSTLRPRTIGVNLRASFN